MALFLLVEHRNVSHGGAGSTTAEGACEGNTCMALFLLVEHRNVSHGGAGSTTAEGACESVRLACQQLVERTLAPMMQEVAEAQKQDTAEAKWKAVLKEASGPMTFPNRQLSAYAIFDGSRRDKPPGLGPCYVFSCSTRTVKLLVVNLSDTPVL